MRCGKQRAQTAEVGSRHSRQAHTPSLPLQSQRLQDWPGSPTGLVLEGWVPGGQGAGCLETGLEGLREGG